MGSCVCRLVYCVCSRLCAHLFLPPPPPNSELLFCTHTSYMCSGSTCTYTHTHKACTCVYICTCTCVLCGGGSGSGSGGGGGAQHASLLFYVLVLYVQSMCTCATCVTLKIM
eukprot:GHVS01055603.1.p3 GENE.GHVS01055603.1~~GHVS01055603.1.p3  ORF type:complete len:112 (-),score=22.03 GHVS01055603.1:540-875(-)